MIEVKTTTGIQIIDPSLIKAIKEVLKTRTPEFDSYDILFIDGSSLDVFEREFPRDKLLGLIKKNDDGTYSKRKFLGIF